MGCVGGLSHCMDGSCVQGVCPEVVIGLSVFFGAAAAALVFQRWWIQSDSNLLIDALLRHNDKSRRLRRKKDDDASGSDSDVPDDDDDGADGADTLLLVNRPDPRHASRRGGGRAAVGAGAGGTEMRHMAGDVSGKTGGKSEGVRRQASLSLPAKAADVHVGSKKGEHRGQREAGHGEMTADTRRVMQGSLVEAGWGDHADGEEDMDMVLHEPQGLVLGEVEGKDIDRPGSEWAAQRQGQAGAPRGKQSSARARARVGGEGDRGRGVLRDRARRDQGIAGQGEGEEGAAEGGRDLEEGMVVDGGSSDDDRGWGRAGAEEVVGAAKQLMTRFRLGSLAAIKKDSASKGMATSTRLVWLLVRTSDRRACVCVRSGMSLPVTCRGTQQGRSGVYSDTHVWSNARFHIICDDISMHAMQVDMPRCHHTPRVVRPLAEKAQRCSVPVKPHGACHLPTTARPDKARRLRWRRRGTLDGGGRSRGQRMTLWVQQHQKRSRSVRHSARLMRPGRVGVAAAREVRPSICWPCWPLLRGALLVGRVVIEMKTTAGLR